MTPAEMSHVVGGVTGYLDILATIGPVVDEVFDGRATPLPVPKSGSGVYFESVLDPNEYTGDPLQYHYAWHVYDSAHVVVNSATSQNYTWPMPSGPDAEDTYEVRLRVHNSPPDHSTSGRATVFSAGYTFGTRVYDPKLEDNPRAKIQYKIKPAGFQASVSLKILDKAKENVVRTIFTDRLQTGGETVYTEYWDGKDEAGRYADPDQYVVRVEVHRQDDSRLKHAEDYWIHVVRLGVETIKIEKHATGKKYRVMFHIRNAAKFTYWEIPAAWPAWSLKKKTGTGEWTSLDDNDGTAKQAPTPWCDTGKPFQQFDSPPQNTGDPDDVEANYYNLPVCFKAQSPFEMVAKMGSEAVSQQSGAPVGVGYPVAGYPIRMVHPEFDPTTWPANLAPGGEYTLVNTNALDPGLGRGKRTFQLKFEYQQSGEWKEIPGHQQTEHVFYKILDDPWEQFNGTTPPNLPWVAALEFVCKKWASGQTTLDGAAGAVTQGIWDAGTTTPKRFVYDTVGGGKTFYTDSPPAGPTIRLTEAIERLNGGIGQGQLVNCRDCGAMVQTFANAVGCHLSSSRMYSGDVFYCNQVIVIGTTAWEVPFGPLYGYFGYHEVAWKGVAGTADAVFDACLKVDDGDPTDDSSHTERLPKDITFGDDSPTTTTPTKVFNPPDADKKGDMVDLTTTDDATIQEYWTVQLTAGSWVVNGSRSEPHPQASATTGTPYESDLKQVGFKITAGTVEFVDGDEFTLYTLHAYNHYREKLAAPDRRVGGVLRRGIHNCVPVPATAARYIPQ